MKKIVLIATLLVAFTGSQAQAQGPLWKYLVEEAYPNAVEMVAQEKHRDMIVSCARDFLLHGIMGRAECQQNNAEVLQMLDRLYGWNNSGLCIAAKHENIDLYGPCE